MTAARELEIRQEARFVLWALRCAVLRERGDIDARMEIARGFAMVGVDEVGNEFWQFADALAAAGWSLQVWHDPRCSCISSEEICVLQALAETSERLRQGDQEPGYWWRTLVPAAAVPMVDVTARQWLAALERVGVAFPRQGELIAGLRPLENMMEPAGPVLLH